MTQDERDALDKIREDIKCNNPGEQWEALDKMGAMVAMIDSLECLLAVQSETTEKWCRLCAEKDETTTRVAEQRDRAIAVLEREHADVSELRSVISEMRSQLEPDEAKRIAAFDYIKSERDAARAMNHKMAATHVESVKARSTSGARGWMRPTEEQ